MPAILPRAHIINEAALERRLINASNNTLLLGSNPSILLDTWLVEYTLSQILMLILIGTLLWNRRSSGSGRSWRGLTLINMMLSMLLNSIINLILYYAGEAKNPNPPTGLCLVQAIIRHGSGPMTEVAIMSLALETFLSTRSAITTKKTPMSVTVLLLALPYFSFLLWAIPIAVMGAVRPINIERVDHAYYCSYNNGPYGDGCTLYGVIAILATAAIQGRTARVLHLNWRSSRSLRASGGIDIPLIIRICVFTVFQILFILATVIELYVRPALAARLLSQGIEVFQAFVPIIAFMLFGLRTSLLKLWFWWWPRSPSTTLNASSVLFNSHIASRSPPGPVPNGRKSLPSVSSGEEGEKRDTV